MVGALLVEELLAAGTIVEILTIFHKFLGGFLFKYKWFLIWDFLGDFYTLFISVFFFKYLSRKRLLNELKHCWEHIDFWFVDQVVGKCKMSFMEAQSGHKIKTCADWLALMLQLCCLPVTVGIITRYNFSRETVETQASCQTGNGSWCHN